MNVYIDDSYYPPFKRKSKCTIAALFVPEEENILNELNKKLDLIDDLCNKRIQKEYLERYKTKLTFEQIHSKSHKLATRRIKLIIKFKNDKKKSIVNQKKFPKDLKSEISTILFNFMKQNNLYYILLQPKKSEVNKTNLYTKAIIEFSENLINNKYKYSNIKKIIFDRKDSVKKSKEIINIIDKTLPTNKKISYYYEISNPWLVLADFIFFFKENEFNVELF